jgi:outer membrane murein-binding lipoprotein Lpp
MRVGPNLRRQALAATLCLLAMSAGAQAQTARPTIVRPAVEAASDTAKLEARIEQLEKDLKALAFKHAALTLGVNEFLKQKPYTEDNVAAFTMTFGANAGGGFEEHRQKINHDLANQNPKAHILAMSHSGQRTYRTEYGNDGFWYLVVDTRLPDDSYTAVLKNCDGCASQQFSVALASKAPLGGGDKFTIVIFK